MPATMLEEALFTRLSTHAGLGALVPAARVYDAQTVPQAPTTPFLTYQRVSGRRLSAMGTDTGLVDARVQITAWAATYATAKTVLAQVRAALQRWRAEDGSISVLDVFLENEVDLPFEPDVPGARGVVLDVRVPYRET